MQSRSLDKGAGETQVRTMGSAGSRSGNLLPRRRLLSFFPPRFGWMRQVVTKAATIDPAGAALLAVPRVVLEACWIARLVEQRWGALCTAGIRECDVAAQPHLWYDLDKADGEPGSCAMAS